MDSLCVLINSVREGICDVEQAGIDLSQSIVDLIYRKRSAGFDPSQFICRNLRLSDQRRL
jgi:hypothetical protein